MSKKSNPTSPLKIVPLGGLGEIGMNCMILEYEDEILLVDCGLLFSDLEHFGVEFVIPDFSYLLERKSKIKGILLTHGHEDHIGALPFALKAGIWAPIYCSRFTSLLVQQRLKEYTLDKAVDMRVFKMGEILKFKHFKVEPVSVNHSIVDAAALLIKTPVGQVIHTGDFKIDPTPFYGRKLDDKIFKKAGEEGVLLLMSDSTNVERHEHSLSESRIYQKFEQLFATAEGLTVVAMFASNVGRMGQVFEIAKKMGKKVAVAGRSMDQNVRLGQEAGYLKDVTGTLIALEDLADYPRDKVIVLSSGSQAEAGSALYRVSNNEHGVIQLGEKDLVLLSSRYIPGNEKAIGKMINNLFKQGADVLYEAIHDIHVSGHATRPELKKMIEWTKPKFFMPIHGEYRHLVHHADVAEETGLDPENIVVGVNGDVIELTENSFEVSEHLEEARILMEGREGSDISKLVVKDRRKLAEAGVAFVLLVRNSDSKKILAGPEVVVKGLSHESREPHMIEQATKQMKKVIREYEAAMKKHAPHEDLQETLRIELRRFFKSYSGKKPTVMPIILDL